MRIFLRSKIHNATVTEANIHYTGSITLDETLMEAADILEYEKVLVSDLTNGNRLETYVIKGERDSGTICMNGAAAHPVQAGDRVIIMAFEITDSAPQPKILILDEQNKVLRQA